MLKKSSGLLILLLLCKSDALMSMDLKERPSKKMKNETSSSGSFEKLPLCQEMRSEDSYEDIKKGVEKDLNKDCDTCCEVIVGGLCLCLSGLWMVSEVSNFFSQPWMGNPATVNDY